MESLNVGIDSWIIQDGNYDDFTVGQNAEFALEFFPQTLEISECSSQKAVSLKNNLYQICGRVVYVKENVWVLDIGFLVYQESVPPEFAAQNSWVEGEIYLGVDPFFYFEYLYKLPEMPALKYKFEIERILLETTPCITGEKMIFRDKEKESFKDVTKTDAWNDDDGNGTYILECRRL